MVPPEIAQRLRASYANLPPRSVRWTTIAGRQYHALLYYCVDSYGTAPTARVLGLSRASIRAALQAKTVQDIDAIDWPDENALRELKKAWAVVLALNERHIAVRSTMSEFRRMQHVVQSLQSRYPLEILSRAAGIELRRLKKYGIT